MLKTVAATMVALAIAGFSTVYAQQRFGGSGDDSEGTRFDQRYQPSIDDLKAFTDARIAALKAGLQLHRTRKRTWRRSTGSARPRQPAPTARRGARSRWGTAQLTDPFVGGSVAPTRCRSSAPHSNTSPIGASRFIKALPTPRNTGSSFLPTFYGRTR